MKSMDQKIAKLWDNLIEYGIATEAELQLVTNINGYNKETLKSVLYARTAYRSWKQYAEAELV